jgi:AhpD family alkylhydroperoxidase
MIVDVSDSVYNLAGSLFASLPQRAMLKITNCNEVILMTDYQEKLNEARANNRNLFGALGETGKGFNAMHDAAVKDGALDLKTKELEAIAMRCEGCIVQHAKACLKAGVTRDELVETIGIAVMMGGGPATVYGGKALDCYDQFVQASK